MALFSFFHYINLLACIRLPPQPQLSFSLCLCLSLPLTFIRILLYHHAVDVISAPAAITEVATGHDRFDDTNDIPAAFAESPIHQDRPHGTWGAITAIPEDTTDQE